ncbi:hypothetical protein SAMN05444156_2233 [Verrucomicrobium sp. GAS474]|uniref:hypothetical protein n=1 Tax=Verrucomicrobium sp. GAS474 TaxID=1882831 RepID=UPI00087D9F8E|nr:hypothetical protein [Verrucomicrobium sp. GAS474]SDU14566.1 hypothetical protein SAMN05444156_2233 [Verrucomicrobium sp. GAS474]
MKAFPLLSLALLVTLLAGCAGAPPPAPSYENPGPGWVRNDQDETVLFLITDDSMAKLIDIVNPTGFNKTAGGQKAIKVTCRLGNLTLQPLAIQIRALFKKNDGSTIDSSAWQNALLPPAPAYVPFEASNESGLATKVVIELRRKP